MSQWLNCPPTGNEGNRDTDTKSSLKNTRKKSPNTRYLVPFSLSARKLWSFPGLSTAASVTSIKWTKHHFSAVVDWYRGSDKSCGCERTLWDQCLRHYWPNETGRGFVRGLLSVSAVPLKSPCHWRLVTSSLAVPCLLPHQSFLTHSFA